MVSSAEGREGGPLCSFLICVSQYSQIDHLCPINYEKRRTKIGKTVIDALDRGIKKIGV